MKSNIENLNIMPIVEENKELRQNLESKNGQHEYELFSVEETNHIQNVENSTPKIEESSTHGGK